MDHLSCSDSGWSGTQIKAVQKKSPEEILFSQCLAWHHQDFKTYVPTPNNWGQGRELLGFDNVHNILKTNFCAHTLLAKKYEFGNGRRLKCTVAYLSKLISPVYWGSQRFFFKVYNFPLFYFWDIFMVKNLTFRLQIETNRLTISPQEQSSLVSWFVFQLKSK